MRQAFQGQTGVELPEEENADSTSNHFFIPLKPGSEPLFGDEPANHEVKEADLPINWQIITQAPTLSNRLHEFCWVG
jgi:hypothetical protein